MGRGFDAAKRMTHDGWRWMQDVFLNVDIDQ
jgi:hypothetical protein